MKTRNLNGKHILPLGFGTSTFVQGKLCPEADSERGIKILNAIADMGISVIHSSVGLKTQWGVKEALCKRTDRNGFLHLVKVKLNPDSDYEDVKKAYKDNFDNLGAGSLLLQLEFDTKTCYMVKLQVLKRILGGNAQWQYPLFLFLNTEEDAIRFIGMKGIDGFVAKYNNLNKWLHPYLTKIEEAGQACIIVSPFAGGNSVDLHFLSQCFSERGISCVIAASDNLLHWQEMISLLD